jgi:hypothetical protein
MAREWRGTLPIFLSDVKARHRGISDCRLEIADWRRRRGEGSFIVHRRSASAAPVRQFVHRCAYKFTDTEAVMANGA